MTMRKNTVVVDLDSTLCDTSPRHNLQPLDPEIRHTNVGWHPYSLACGTDLVIESTAALLRALHPHNIIVLLSARAQAAIVETVSWLDGNAIPYDMVRLRHDEEPQAPEEFKLLALRDLQLMGHNITLVIDDYLETCEMVKRELGIPALHVHQPVHYDSGVPL